MQRKALAYVAVVFLDRNEQIGALSIRFCDPEMWQSGPESWASPSRDWQNPLAPNPRAENLKRHLGVFTKGRTV